MAVLSLPVLYVVIAVQMLLSLDVPSVSRNYNEQTPYELALNNGHAECAAAIGNRLDVLLWLDKAKLVIFKF